MKKRNRVEMAHVKALNLILDEIWDEAVGFGLTDADLARESGLAYTTIWNYSTRASASGPASRPSAC